MIFKPFPFIAAVSILPVTVLAGVETLTSQEMVDTYIKDSAVIVVPRNVKPEPEKREEPEQARIIRTITITPAEPVVSEAEIERIRMRIRDTQQLSFKDAETLAEEQLIRSTLSRSLDEITALQPAAATLPSLPNLIYGQRLQIPEHPFTETYLNNQLGLNYDGQSLALSIGNPPGINQVDLPRGISEGPIQLTPRPGGGFDLKVEVPDAR